MSKLNEKPFYNADTVSGAVDEDDIFNCYLELSPDSGLSIRRRPGLKPFTDLGSGLPGDGIYEWESVGIVLAVSGGQVYKLSSNGTFINITTDSLEIGVPVQFAAGSKLDSTPWLYIANGKLVYSDNGANVIYPTDVNTPATADSVVYLNLRFLANEPGTNRFYFTDTDPLTSVLEPDYWSASDNPLTCESRGDDLAHMEEFLEEIYNFGTESIEVWQDDGVTPFTSLPQATMRAGLESKYSIVQADNTLFALCIIDGVRCVVRLQGRSPQVISYPIQNILSSYGTVSDAIGQLISVDGINLYMLQFPTEGKTWVYDLVSDNWTQWGTWNTTTNQMGQFIGQHSRYIRMWNKHLIMSRVDGKIYEFDRDTYTDDGALIKSYRRSAWDDRGDMRTKEASRLRVKVKAGDSINGAVYLRFADNGELEWSEYMEIPIGPVGQRNFIAEFTQMGKYHSRKYEVSITDDADLCFVRADEEVRMLRF